MVVQETHTFILCQKSWNSSRFIHFLFGECLGIRIQGIHTPSPYCFTYRDITNQLGEMVFFLFLLSWCHLVLVSFKDTMWLILNFWFSCFNSWVLVLYSCSTKPFYAALTVNGKLYRQVLYKLATPLGWPLFKYNLSNNSSLSSNGT